MFDNAKLSSFSGSSYSDRRFGKVLLPRGLGRYYSSRGHGMSECSDNVVEILRCKWMPVDIWPTCVTQLMLVNKLLFNITVNGCLGVNASWLFSLR